MCGAVYRREAPSLVEENRREALSITMCIIQNFGPMGFLVQEEGKNQKFKVRIYIYIYICIKGFHW